MGMGHADYGEHTRGVRYLRHTVFGGLYHQDLVVQ